MWMFCIPLFIHSFYFAIKNDEPSCEKVDNNKVMKFEGSPSNPIHCKSILAITWPINANKGNSSQIKTYLLNEILREIKRERICNSFYHTTQPIYFLTASLTENLLNLLTNWLFLSFRVSWVFSSWVHLDIQEENNNQQSRP
jgi:hypothetical protein